MGSTGSGSFTDYPGSTKEKDKGQGSGGSGGGGEQPDRCAKAFAVTLEDVEHNDFFKAHGGVPNVGTELRVAHKKRIVAVTTSGEVVGNLPISMNYLAACLKDGYTYTGVVRASSAGTTVAIVSADFAATPPA